MGQERMRAGKARRKRGVVLFLLTALACTALLLLALCPAALAVSEPSEEDLYELKVKAESLGEVVGFYHMEVRDDAVFAGYAEGYDPQSMPSAIDEEGDNSQTDFIDVMNEDRRDEYREAYNILVVIKLPGGTYTSGLWSLGWLDDPGWSGGEGSGCPPGPSTGKYGKGSSVSEVLGAYEKNFDMIEEIPVPGGEGETTEEGEEEEVTGEEVVEEEGSKIPGPGSWWQWLTGTVVAGVIAAGISLVNMVFPSTPPPPPVAEPSWPEPPEPGIAGGTVDPFVPPPEPLTPLSDAEKKKLARARRAEEREAEARRLEGLDKSMLEATVKNIRDDLRKPARWILSTGEESLEKLRDLTRDPLKPLEEGLEAQTEVMDTIADYIREDAGEDIRNLPGKVLDVKKGLESWGQKDLDAMRKAINDPLGFMEKLSESNKELLDSAAEILKNDPWAPVKFIVAWDLMQDVADYNKPLSERFVKACLVTVNTIGLMQGAGGLKSWLTGADDVARWGDDAARGMGLVDDTVKGTVPKRRLIRTGKTGLIDDGVKGTVPKGTRSRVTRVKARKTGYKVLSETERAKLPAAWKGAQEQAESKVDDLVEALQSKNPKVRRDAVLKVQGDDLAKVTLDGKDPGVIKGFNRELGKMQKDALEKTRLEIAKAHGVDPHRVSVFKAKNPSARVKVSMDDDFTVQVLEADGTIVDVDPAELQRAYDRNFYEAAGKPKGVTPKQLGEACRNKAVDSKSAEAYVDYKKVQKGLVSRDPTAVGKTITYKADEEFALADKLFKEGKTQVGMKKRLVGMRETGKQFNNQVRSRAGVIRGQLKPGSAKLKWLDNKLGSVEDTVSEMNRMVAQGKNPVEIESFLRSKGTTAEDLSKRVGEIYEELTIWAKR